MNRTWKIQTEEIECDNRTKIIFARFTAIPVSLNTAVAACWRFSLLLLLFFLSEYEQLQSLATAVVTFPPLSLSLSLSLLSVCWVYGVRSDMRVFTTERLVIPYDWLLLFIIQAQNSGWHLILNRKWILNLCLCIRNHKFWIFNAIHARGIHPICFHLVTPD